MDTAFLYRAGDPRVKLLWADLISAYVIGKAAWPADLDRRLLTVAQQEEWLWRNRN